MQDVVEETDAGLHLGSSFAVEFEAHPYIRLACFSFSSSDPRHRSSRLGSTVPSRNGSWRSSFLPGSRTCAPRAFALRSRAEETRSPPLAEPRLASRASACHGPPNGRPRRSRDRLRRETFRKP